LSPGDLIRLGRQILVLDSTDGAFAIQHYDPTGLMVAEHPVPEGTIVLGRSGGKSDPDVVLAGEDMTLSRFHMEIERTGSQVLAEDFNSRNGTYLRVTDAAEVEHDDVIRVGGQTLRLNLLQDAPIKQGSEPTGVVAAPSLAVAPAPAPPPTAAAVAASVTFEGLGITLPINASQTILEVADEGDVDLDYECWIGKCGADLIQILEGRENLSEVSEQEGKTIKRKGAEPGEFRLACMTRCSGPVVVRAVD
jgi:ferredoxin